MNDEMIVSRALLRQALEALEWSVDTVQAEYDSDWRHGIPTRKAALDRMLEALNAHKSSITAIRTTLETAEKAKPVRGVATSKDYGVVLCKPGRELEYGGFLYSAPVASEDAKDAARYRKLVAHLGKLTEDCGPMDKLLDSLPDGAVPSKDQLDAALDEMGEKE